MQKFLIIVIILVFASLLTSAQTQDISAAQTASPLDYSESLPYQPREFPVKEKSKPKKESKKNKQAMGELPDVTGLSSKMDETITIPVSVFDANGKFVTNLKQSDFKIFADGEEQEILSVGKRDEPINLILLIDTSPSTVNRIEEIQNYALATVERLKPEDKVMVIEFNVQTKVLSELTSDRRVITKAIRKAKFGDGTSLYEAVKNTFDEYANPISGRTAVVLLTDGVDTTSFRATYADSLMAAEKKNAAVFPVYFDTFQNAAKTAKKNKTIFPGILNGSVIAGGLNRAQGITVAEYEIGKMYLVDISTLSGGRSRVVKDITNTRVENVENIGGEMRVQYQVTFRPTNFAVGQRKQIRVRVNRPNLRVQARGSLIVGGNNKKTVIK